MKRFLDKCCARCFHSNDNPCHQLIECCLRGPLCHEDETCSQMRQTIISNLAHSCEYVQQPDLRQRERGGGPSCTSDTS